MTARLLMPAIPRSHRSLVDRIERLVHAPDSGESARLTTSPGRPVCEILDIELYRSCLGLYAPAAHIAHVCDVTSIALWCIGDTIRTMPHDLNLAQAARQHTCMRAQTHYGQHTWIVATPGNPMSWIGRRAFSAAADESVDLGAVHLALPPASDCLTVYMCICVPVQSVSVMCDVRNHSDSCVRP